MTAHEPLSIVGSTLSHLQRFWLWLFTSLSLCAGASAAESAPSNEWTHAFLTLSNHLWKANPEMHYAEFRSPLLTRYIPHLRLYDKGSN
jgi:hypothetical protein